MRKLKRKKKLNKLDVYLIFSIGMCIIYTIVCLILFKQTQAEPSTLTTCFFGLFGSEIAASAFIKIFNIKREDRSESLEKESEEESYG